MMSRRHDIVEALLSNVFLKSETLGNTFTRNRGYFGKKVTLVLAFIKIGWVDLIKEILPRLPISYVGFY